MNHTAEHRDGISWTEIVPTLHLYLVPWWGQRGRGAPGTSLQLPGVQELPGNQPSGPGSPWERLPVLKSPFRRRIGRPGHAGTAAAPLPGSGVSRAPLEPLKGVDLPQPQLSLGWIRVGRVAHVIARSRASHRHRGWVKNLIYFRVKNLIYFNAAVEAF